MASFKLCISDAAGKTYQKEVKDAQAGIFMGLNIGESVKGESFEMGGYEFQITGGSDYCGFPMRKGILGTRKKITIYGGIGFKGAAKGIKKRKTVVGHKIHDNISQINMKVTKVGAKKLAEIFGAADKKEEKTEEKEVKPAKEDKKEAKPEAKEEKKEVKQEAKEEKKEAKHPAGEGKKEVSKPEAKAENKPEAKEEKQEAKPEPKHEKKEAKEEKPKAEKKE
jgi:small subunit ribosomal protein S6e